MNRVQFPEEFIERVRETADISEVASNYCDLKPWGAGKERARCPFHEERTASFELDLDRGLYHCFGCQAGGDTIRLVMEMENLTFPDALRLLADQAGIEVPGSNGVPLPEPVYPEFPARVPYFHPPYSVTIAQLQDILLNLNGQIERGTGDPVGCVELLDELRTFLVAEFGVQADARQRERTRPIPPRPSSPPKQKKEPHGP